MGLTVPRSASSMVAYTSRSIYPFINAAGGSMSSGLWRPRLPVPGLLLVAPLAFPLAGDIAAQSTEPATLILTNAVIHTVDPNRPKAQAVAIRGDRIVFVGSERGAMLHRGRGTRVIDLEGLTVVPGFIDAHAHLAGLGDRLRILDLTGTHSYAEIIERVRERAQDVASGRWIRAPRCSIDFNGFFSERIMSRILNVGSKKCVVCISW